MKALGLTGGMGMGKSTCAQLLRQRGAAVVDADDLARQVVLPGQPALAEIQQAFGNDIVGPDNQLRRDDLARVVFANPAARKRLEAILHPRIRDRWQTHVANWREQGVPLAVVVIPLLFETNAQVEFDATICVACSAATQRQRLLARGWTMEQIEQRLAAQWPVERKIARADYLIWTEAGLDVLAPQLWRIVPTP
jgi:dephospho-CoA kinase